VRQLLFTADFGEVESRCPICTGSTEEIARRRGRVEYRCLVCALEFDVFETTGRKSEKAGRGRVQPPMSHDRAEINPVVEGRIHA
jgi:transposase-like protein